MGINRTRVLGFLLLGVVVVTTLAVMANWQSPGGDPPATTPSVTAPTSTAPPLAAPEPTELTSPPTTAIVSTTSTSIVPSTSTSSTTTTASIPMIRVAGETEEPEFRLAIRVESRIAEQTTEDFSTFVLQTLNDERGWRRAGVSFVLDATSPLLVVVANPDEVDSLCAPLRTRGRVSCQNGVVVALNRDRWLSGPEPDKGWDSSLETYRTYLVNHEVGHLFGLRHPTSRCPIAGGRAAVMEQQTGGLVGCTGNGWPLEWEIGWASRRPAMIAPLPEWAGPFPENPGDQG